MMKKKVFKYVFIIGGTAAVIGIGVFLYMFFMPHRDIQATSVDFKLTATALVEEYLSSESEANDKYLQEEGESKILSVSGIVRDISENLDGNKVIILQDGAAPAGVRCTFMPNTNANVSEVNLGEQLVIKGVIRSGATYDEDLEMYEDVILEKCDVIK